MNDSNFDYDNYYTLLHAMPLGVCIFDETYVIRFWNRCVESWTKIASSSIVGRNVSEFSPHLLEPKFTSRFELLFQGGPPVIFSTQLHGSIIPSTLPGGMERLQHTVARAFKEKTSGQNSVLMTMQDVTEAHMRLRDYARMHATAQHEIEMRRKTEAVLRESEESFASAFEYAANGMASGGLDEVWLKANHALCAMLELGEHELIGKNMCEFVLPEDADLGARQKERLLFGHVKSYQVEKRFVTRSGKSIWVLLSVSLVQDEKGQPSYFIAQLENVTKRKQLELELYILATTDHLTSISNRREFLSRTEHELQRCRRQGTMLAFLMLDVYTFKLINDTWGHSSGDKVLKAMTETCRAILRSTDIFGRLGGEEFGIVLTEVERGEAEIIAERVRLAISELVVKTEHAVIQFTVSIGIAFFSDGLSTVEYLMRRADAALYEAKTKGRNQVFVAGDRQDLCPWPMKN
jgi:diguanylate cyclase (GGDEF)-like protein/PAS domain S-box-containing protein